MDFLKQHLSDLNAGKILDFGTGRGQFVRVLMESFASYESITGVDVVDPKEQIEMDLWWRDDIEWLTIEPGPLPFPDESFDTVSISSVLHHLKPELVVETLRDLLRVLKPGGLLIVVECVRDTNCEARRTQVCFHHWRAKIAHLCGIDHYPTMSKTKLLEIIEELGLSDVKIGEHSPFREDWHDKANLDRIAAFMDRQLDPIRGYPEFEKLSAILQKLKLRMYRTGYLGASFTIAVGRKTLRD